MFTFILFHAYATAITGRRLPSYRGYNKKVDPSVSLLFSTAAYRIGHTLVGPDIQRFGCGNAVLPALKLKDVFFTSPTMLGRHKMEQFVRGMMLTKAQEVDAKVTDLLRNFLFTGVKEEDVFDLAGASIIKSSFIGDIMPCQMFAENGKRLANPDFNILSFAVFLCF